MRGWQHNFSVSYEKIGEMAARQARELKTARLGPCESLARMTAYGTKRRKLRRRVYVSFWGSSGRAWTDGLGRLRPE
jgi:hypothetical protein